MRLYLLLKYCQTEDAPVRIKILHRLAPDELFFLQNARELFFSVDEGAPISIPRRRQLMADFLQAMIDKEEDANV